MRKYKFRAWDLYNNKMILLGDLETISLHKDYDFANYKVMQYTGLCDKNGVEIYEGDLIRIQNRNLKGDIFEELVRFQDSEWQVGNLSLFNFQKIGDICEVIGNIYETKEIIKDAYSK